jgi:hypothetical protein
MLFYDAVSIAAVKLRITFKKRFVWQVGVAYLKVVFPNAPGVTQTNSVNRQSRQSPSRLGLDLGI